MSVYVGIEFHDEDYDYKYIDDEDEYETFKDFSVWVDVSGSNFNLHVYLYEIDVINFLKTGKIETNMNDYSPCNYVEIDRDSNIFSCSMTGDGRDGSCYVPSFEYKNEEGTYVYNEIKQKFTEKIKNLDSFIEKFISEHC